MYPLSSHIRLGWCCTTHLCRPCCGSGWRPGTFINRWPRSLRRAKMVTRLRPLNSLCWSKHRCPRNPPEPWLLLDSKEHKHLCACTQLHTCFCACVCVSVSNIWIALLLPLAVCVPLHKYLLSYFIFFCHNLTETERFKSYSQKLFWYSDPLLT